MKHQHTKKFSALAQGLATFFLSAIFAAQPGLASDGSAPVPRGDAVQAIIRLPSAVVGQRYARRLILGGKPPHTLTVEGLDDVGLSLDATGLLSGLPTKPGKFVFTLTAQDTRAGEAVRQRFELQVLKARKAR